MQFGSVAFFKVLIKTVLCIVFFVPLVLCVVFAVLLWNKSAEVRDIQHYNERLEYYAAILSGEREPTVKGFYDVYARSGLSDEGLIEYVLHGKDESQPAANMSGGTSSASSASSGSSENSAFQTVDTAEAESSAESEADAAETNQTTQQASQPESPYADIYPDMMVNAPAESDYVRELSIMYLTLDDSPSENTNSKLSYLEQYNVKAPFFVVPPRSEGCYAKLKAIAAAGHSIGVHSASHVYKDIYSSVEAYLDDFHEAWDIIYDATGIKTEIFRFPGGSVNDFNTETRDKIIQEMTRRGFRYYDWNVESGDVDGATWTDMYNSIPSDIANCYRSIVLMHDSNSTPNTVLVLGDVLHVLVSDGYKFDKINNDTRPVQFTGPFA